MEINHVGTYVFNGTLKDLGRLEFAAHGADMDTRPHLEARKGRKAKKKKQKKLQMPQE